jgi:hypothetical protein
MASTLKVDQIETPSGVGNISFAQPISGDGSQLTGVGLAVGGGAVVAGDFLYHDGVEWTRLPKGTAAQYLRMNAGATAPEWIATSGAGIQEPASSAAGDILYYDGSNYVRLAKGTAGQQLAINAGATAPEWIAPAAGTSFYLGALTRVGNLPTQAIAYTGVGFQPDLVIFLSAQDAVKSMTVGWSDGTINQGLAINNLTPYWTTARTYIIDFPTNGEQKAHMASMDVDGFTLNWYNTAATPPATLIQTKYLALKF